MISDFHHTFMVVKWIVLLNKSLSVLNFCLPQSDFKSSFKKDPTGNQGDTNLRVNLQKYIILAALFQNSLLSFTFRHLCAPLPLRSGSSHPDICTSIPFSLCLYGCCRHLRFYHTSAFLSALAQRHRFFIKHRFSSSNHCFSFQVVDVCFYIHHGEGKESNEKARVHQLNLAHEDPRWLRF